MDRLEAFEKLLKDTKNNYESEKQQMDELLAQGKEKSATYRQFMGNRLMYKWFFSLCREYGLME